MADKKLTIAIDTTADASGAELIRQKLDDLQREANETGQSFDSLARKEFGNLSNVFDEFNAELGKAQKQLDDLSSKGVDVKLAASGLERLRNDLRTLRADVAVDIDTDGAKKKVASVSDGLDVKVKVDDSAVDETVRKVDALESDTAVVKVETLDGSVDETARKVGQLDDDAKVNISVNDAKVDAAVKKVSQLDSEAVDVKVNVDTGGLAKAKQDLGAVKDKNVTVTTNVSDALGDLQELRAQLEKVKTEASKALAFKAGDDDLTKLGTRLQDLQKQLAKVGTSGKAFDLVSNSIRRTRVEIDRTAQAKGFTQLRADAKKTEVSAERLENKLDDVRDSISGLDSNAPTLANTQAAINELTAGIGDLSKGTEDTTRDSGKLSKGFSGVAVKAATAAAGVISITGALAAFKSAVASASLTQDLEVQLEVLLGSADAAQERIAELRDFAATTPFELPGLAESSRILETLTDGALSTGEGLRLVGDLAAGTGESFQNLAVHLGRVYDGLNNGTPVGESLLRLQELGIVSAATRVELEELQKTNAAGSDVWARAVQDFNRFGGAMEKRSQTLSGVFSTLRDNFTQLLATLGKPALAPLTGVLKDLIGVTVKATSITKDFLKVLGLYKEVAPNAARQTVDAYDKISRAAEASGKIAKKAAAEQAKAFKSTVEELDKLKGALDETTDFQIEYTNAVIDRKIAEVNAGDGTAEEKATEVLRLESLRRIEIFDAENTARVKAVELAEQRVADLRAEQAGKQTNLAGPLAERAALQKQLDLTNQLAAAQAAVKDEQIALNDKFAALSGEERDAQREEFIEINREITKRGRAYETQIKDLEAITSRDDLEANFKKLAKTIGDINGEIQKLDADLLDAQKDVAATRAESLRETAQANKLFRENERKIAAEQRGRAKEAFSAAQEGIAKDELKDVETTRKKLNTAVKEQAAALLKLAKDERADQSFQDDLAEISKQLQGDDDLTALTQFVDSFSTENTTARQFADAIDRLIAQRGAVDTRYESLRQQVDVLTRSGPGATQSNASVRQTNFEVGRDVETSARAVQGQVGNRDPKLAEEVGKATTALQDGATVDELRKLSSVLAQVDTTQSDLLRKLVSAATRNVSASLALQSKVAEVENKLGALTTATKRNRQ